LRLPRGPRRGWRQSGAPYAHVDVPQQLARRVVVAVDRSRPSRGRRFSGAKIRYGQRRAPQSPPAPALRAQEPEVACPRDHPESPALPAAWRARQGSNGSP
jgi:hypothetical protein